MAVANNQLINSIFVISSYGRYSMEEIIRKFRARLSQRLSDGIIH